MSDAFATMHAQLTDAQLFSRFRAEKWEGMPPAERLQLLQELENREAHAQGRAAYQVVPERTNAAESNMGAFDGRVIRINELFLTDACMPDNAARFTVASALDTIIHEGRHAYQQHVVNGRDKSGTVPDDVRRIWLINNIAYSNSTETAAGFALYAIQPIERDARSYAAQEVKRIYRYMVREGGRDLDFEDALDAMLNERVAEMQLARQLTPEQVREEEFRLAEKLRANVTGVGKVLLKLLGVQVGADSHDLFGPIMEMLKNPDGVRAMLDGLDDLQLDDLSDLPDDPFAGERFDLGFEPEEMSLDDLFALAIQDWKTEGRDAAPWREKTR